jgi:hypothetical protein
MRSLLTRLAAIGVFAATVAGCSGAAGTNLPASAFPNGAAGNGGGQLTNVTTPTGVNTTLTVPANTLQPTALFFTTTAPFSGFNVTATSVATAGTFTQDAPPTNLPPSNSTGAFAYPAPPTSFDAITFQATQGSQNPTLLKGPVSPALFVNYVTPQVSTPVTLSTIVVHASLTGGGAPNYAGATLGLELVGGTGAGAYDVRVNCGTLTSTVTAFSCGPLPGYGQVQTTPTGGFVPQQTVPATVPSFLNPANPTATGAYTGGASTVYAVVTYGAALPTGPTTLNIGYVYAKQ